MNMAALSAGTSNLTTTRDSVGVLLEGKNGTHMPLDKKQRGMW
jgi:hypothetical protein